MARFTKLDRARMKKGEPATRYDSLTGETYAIEDGERKPLIKRVVETIKEVVYGHHGVEVNYHEKPSRRSVESALRAAGQELVVPSRPDGVIDFTGRGDELRRSNHHVTSQASFFRPRRRTFIGK